MNTPSGHPRDLVVTGAGTLLWCGEDLASLRRALAGDPGDLPREEVAPGEVRGVGRIGRLRAHPFSRRYERFGQIDTFSRYAFVAAGHALDAAGLVPGSPEATASAVVLGTAFGCMEANQLFDQFTADPLVGLRGASPLHFKGTLHNAPAGWCAVGWQLRGPNATFVSGPSAGMEAIALGCRMVREGRAPRALVGGVERLLALQLLMLEGGDGLPGPSEGAAILVVEDADRARERGAPALLRVLGTARGTARGGVGPLLDLLDAAGLSPSDLERVLPGPPVDGTPVGGSEAVATLALPRHVEVARPEARIGDPLAAWGASAVASLLAEAEGPVRVGPTAVHQAGAAGEHHWMLVRGP
ncbi:hypothetical protein L6R50_06000 [Myxococcota bacterium]|nr:hypothetical protein [Myxococcota bacterium]